MKHLDLLKLFCLGTYLLFVVLLPTGLISGNILYNEPPMYIIRIFMFLPFALLLLEFTDKESWTAKLLRKLQAKFPGVKKKSIEKKNIFLPTLHARLSVLTLSLGAVLSLTCLTMFALDIFPKILMKAGYLEAAERTYKCLKPGSRRALLSDCYRSDVDYDEMWRPVDKYRKEVDQSKVNGWFARQEKVTAVIEKVYGANSFEMMEWKHELGGNADQFKRYPLAAKFYQDSFGIAKHLGLKKAELDDFSWMTLYEALEVRRSDDPRFNERTSRHLQEGLKLCHLAQKNGIDVDFAATNFAGAAEMIEDINLHKSLSSMRLDQRQSSYSEWPGMEVIRITEKYKI